MDRNKFCELFGDRFINMSISKFKKTIIRETPVVIKSTYQKKILKDENYELDKKLKIILRNAKNRCIIPSNKNTRYYINKKIRCNLTLAEVRYLWFRDKAFGIIKPSLDRIDSNSDYHINNCRFIEWEINRKRNKNKLLPT